MEHAETKALVQIDREATNLPDIQNQPPSTPMRSGMVDMPSAPTPVAGGILVRIRTRIASFRIVHARAKQRVREEIRQVPGLMTLLMKPRNGQKWTAAERTELRTQFRRLSRLSLYLTTAALPGTIFTLPLIAWWLEQRRKKRDNAALQR